MADYRAPMPQKLSQSRSTTGGYPRGQIVRAGVNTQHAPTIKTGGMKNVDLMPSPTNSPTLPAEENGFAPDEVVSEHEPDAQSMQTDAPEIEESTESPEVPATSAEPSEAETSDPVPGAADPGPTGGAAKPGYPGVIPSATPVGYPSN